jgi:hypothetical protein
MKTTALLLALALGTNSVSAAGCTCGVDCLGSDLSCGWEQYESGHATTGGCYIGGGKSDCAFDASVCFVASGTKGYYIGRSSTTDCHAANADVVQYNNPTTVATGDADQDHIAYSCNTGWEDSNGASINPLLSATQCTSANAGVCIVHPMVGGVGYQAETPDMSDNLVFNDNTEANCQNAGMGPYDEKFTWKAWTTAQAEIAYVAPTKHLLTMASVDDISVGDAVTGPDIPAGIFVSAIDTATKEITLTKVGTVPSSSYGVTQDNAHGDTDSAVPANTDLTFYPTEVVPACRAKFGICYRFSDHDNFAAYDPSVCPNGYGFYTHDSPSVNPPRTFDQVKIGFCYSELGKAQDGTTDIAEFETGLHGWCALSAAQCDWAKPPGRSPGITAKTTFVEAGDANYPTSGCYLDDVIGFPATSTETATGPVAACPILSKSGAGRAPAVTAVTALLLASAALLSAITA